ncbi:MAG TPA: LysR substrate-binding domain-containing protein [Dokdonella sp.]|uniref:LysR substrate-binding domain-containing protein n=1 Tax=Dokdonella sp. TaxID=2291710 RepID=UPI002CBD19FD|nr:LysR substrate-binding domain-containing protein [Dokdonella sp.]HUD43060.1 LysR substrate-binding domain-containing protein [Dokdonella sp.]
MRHDGLADLNDLRFFAAVVEHGGFSAAARVLGVPKSRLSKRVALLEQRLGVRLLQRTTRRLALTEVGERFHGHCRAMLEQAQAAQDAVDTLRAEPSGTVRLSCPVTLAQTLLAAVLPAFLERHPKIALRLIATNRRVDVIGEGIDVALRVRERDDAEPSLVARTIGPARAVLVASPGFLDRHGRPQTPRDLAGYPLLSPHENESVQRLRLLDADGAAVEVAMDARLVCGDFVVLHEAARRGLGVALLPDFVCAAALAHGELEALLPAWGAPQGIIHFVYASRRGLLPGVRALIDYLAQTLPAQARALPERCIEAGAPAVSPVTAAPNGARAASR